MPGANVRLWDVLHRSIFGSRRPPRSSDGPRRGEAAGNSATAAPQNPKSSAPESPAARWWTPADGALLEWLPPAQPDLSTEALGLARILSGYTQRNDVRLPTLPRTVERVLRLLADADYSASQVADEIAEDQVISAAVLRLANCALYGGYVRVHTLQAAVTRLGATALRTVMLQHSLQVAEQRRGGDRYLAAVVWNGSLASAYLMRALAGVLQRDAATAYLTGLLHDIGNVLVLGEAQDQQALLKFRMDLPTFTWLCHEHHQRLGQLIADAWQLPEEFKATIGEHHRPMAPDVPAELAMLTLADMIKAMLGYAPPRAYNLAQSEAVRRLGLADRPEFLTLLDRLPDDLADIETMF